MHTLVEASSIQAHRFLKRKFLDSIYNLDIPIVKTREWTKSAITFVSGALYVAPTVLIRVPHVNYAE